MQNHYAINVAWNKRHLFGTDPRSCTNESDAIRVMHQLIKRFPESEGFKVTCTYWKGAGEDVTERLSKV